MNGKLAEVHAAVGLAVLEMLDLRLARRKGLAERYITRLSGIGDIVFPADANRSTWQIFPVLMPTAHVANAVVDLARQLGMEVRRYYEPSLTRWLRDTPCPNSDSLADRMVCFPIYSCDSSTTVEMVELVEASVTGAFELAQL